MRSGTARSLFHSSLVTCAVWAGAAVAAHAEPLYVRPYGPIPGILGNNPVVISWTLDAMWTDVEISLGLYSACGSFPEPCGGAGIATGHAFLTDLIGPGTTEGANEIVSADLSTSTTEFQTLTAFSGLTLGPGTYYLTYTWGGHILFDLPWAFSDGFGEPPPVVGLGVTAGLTYLYLGDFSGGYAPASEFEVVAVKPVFSITGTRIADPVPEPSVIVLTASGVLALMARRSRLRRRAQPRSAP